MPAIEQATEQKTLEAAPETQAISQNGEKPEETAEQKADERDARIKELESSLEQERQGRRKDAENARSQELALLRQEQRDELLRETSDNVRLLGEAISPLLDKDMQLKLQERQKAIQPKAKTDLSKEAE